MSDIFAYSVYDLADNENLITIRQQVDGNKSTSTVALYAEIRACEDLVRRLRTTTGPIMVVSLNDHRLTLINKKWILGLLPDHCWFLSFSTKSNTEETDVNLHIVM